MAVDVYHNWGRWVADCPQCPNAEHYGPDRHTGHVRGLTRTGFICSLCGYVGRPVWPKRRPDIEGLLARRVSPAEQNWLPGETLGDLQLENDLHGVG